MNELNFEPIDYPLIIQKDKTQTTLIEDKHLKVKEIVNAVFFNENGDKFEYKIPLIITKIVQKTSRDLDNSDGVNEGYSFYQTPLEPLENRLLKAFPEYDDESIVYCYHFRLAEIQEVDHKF